MSKHPPDHRRSLAGMIAAMVLASFAIYSAGSTTHGFVSYYTASKLLVSGELGPLAYDDGWFGEQVQRFTESNIREIFIPNPPTMSLLRSSAARPSRPGPTLPDRRARRGEGEDSYLAGRRSDALLESAELGTHARRSGQSG